MENVVYSMPGSSRSMSRTSAGISGKAEVDYIEDYDASHGDTGAWKDEYRGLDLKDKTQFTEVKALLDQCHETMVAAEIYQFRAGK